MKSSLPNSKSSKPSKRRGRPPKAVSTARDSGACASVQANGVFREITRASGSAGGSSPSNYRNSTLAGSSSSKVRADIPKSQAIFPAPLKAEPRPPYPTSAIPTNSRTQSKQNLARSRIQQKSSGRPAKHAVTLKKAASHTPIRKNANNNSRKRRRDTPSPSPPPEEASSSEDLTAPSDEDLCFVEDLQPSRTSAYPTFISASSSSSSSSSLTEESDDDSDIDVGDDIDLKREEERLLMEQESQRHRGKKNRGPNQGRGRHQQRELKKDPPPAHSNGSSAASSGDDEDDEDDSEDDENDADNLDAMAASDPPEWEGVVGGWTESDEEIDAELFFANFLSDSSSASDEEKAPSASCQHDIDADGDEESFASDEDDDMDGSNPLGRKVPDQYFGSVTLITHPHTTRRSIRGNNGMRQPLPQSRKRKRAPGIMKRKVRPPTIITEDSDGQLIFTDGFRAGDGAVDIDFEQRRQEMRKMLGDGYDSSEESEGLVMSGVEESGHAPVVAPDDMSTAGEKGEQEAGSETETDFTGDSTVDEGLDEDGLPPPKFPSELHKERYNYSGSGEFNLDSNDFDSTQRDNGRLQPYLLPGVELFQNEGSSAIAFGGFDFPASQPPTLHAPNGSKTSEFSINTRKRSASAPHLESPTFTLSPTVLQSTDPFSERLGEHPLSLSTSALATTSPILSPTPADILSGRWRRDTQERQLTVNVMDITASGQQITRLGGPPSSLLPPVELDHETTNKVGLAIEDKEEPRTPSSQSPPRLLPTMGTFTIPATKSPPPEQVMEPAHAENTTPTASKPTRQRPRSFSAATPGTHMTPLKPFAFPRPKCIAVISDRGGAVIDGVLHETIPSPFASVKRRRKSRHLSSGVDGSESSVSAMSGSYRRSVSHVRHSSFAGSVYSSYSQSFTGQSLSTPVIETESFISSPPGMHDSQASIDQSLFNSGPLSPARHLPFAQPVELADVLDSSFLDEDIMMSPTSAQEDDQWRSISKWDRVPMGTFRRSRALSVVGTSSDHPAGHHPSPSTRTLSDGFSYGSQSRTSIPESVLQSTLWSEGPISRTAKNTKGKSKAVTPRVRNKMRHRRMTISPVIFPVRGGSPVGELELDGDGDVGMGTGVEEEEGYFSRKVSKGGREGSLRGKKFDKSTRPPTKKARLASIMEVVSSTPHST